MLLAAFVLSCIDYADPGSGETVIFGIGGVFVIGIGALVLGAVLMIVYSRIAPPFFRGETLVPGDADLLLSRPRPPAPHAARLRGGTRGRARPVEPAARPEAPRPGRQALSAQLQGVLPGDDPPAPGLPGQHVQRRHGVPDVDRLAAGVDGVGVRARQCHVGPEERDADDLVAGPLPLSGPGERGPAAPSSTASRPVSSTPVTPTADDGGAPCAPPAARRRRS